MADRTISRLVVVVAAAFLAGAFVTAQPVPAFSQTAKATTKKTVGKATTKKTVGKATTKKTTGKATKTSEKSSKKSGKTAKNESCGKPTRHKVADGDSLWKIAGKYGTTVDALKRLNGKQASNLHPGRILIVKAAKPCAKVKETRSATPSNAAASPSASLEDGPSETGVVFTGEPVDGHRLSESASTPGTEASASGPRADDVQPAQSADFPDPSAIRQELARAGAYDGTPEIGHDATPPDLVGVPPAQPCELDGFELGAAGDAEDDDDESGIAEDYETGEMPEIELNEFGFSDDGAACAEYLGQFTKMPENPKGSVNIYHTVRKGDTLGRIAKKYRTTVKNLQSMNGLRNNPKKARRLMHPGKKVLIRIGDPKDLVAHRPFLKDWVKLTDGEGFSIKRPSTAYGRPWAMNLMLRAFCELRRRFPDTDNIVVGDWSGIVAGQLSRHLSHKTGRDVDLSYFARGRTGLKHFIKVNAKTMDVGPSWELVRALLDTRQVEYIFMDWTLQREMYEYALERGFKKAELDRVFQYPEGRRVRTGIIRWSKGHDDHIHVRFRCPKDDNLCR
ncbi:MAG TPA: penicillin-insensitive murein endopeptidase [Myxococcota bacterium]|nr:penicillin-insensitive murein endopeptidase [Myxococcota bacterium]HPV05196.1 penicillin-insensitive murein endopeptidase [Myxococcota bacterium]